MKTHEVYYADIQADIIKRSARMKENERFTKWHVDIGDYSYVMYIFERGVIAYIIPSQYDILNTKCSNAPEFIHTLVNTALVDCKIVDITNINKKQIVCFRGKEVNESIWIDFKYFKQFYMRQETYTYKIAEHGINQNLYIFREGILVTIICGIRPKPPVEVSNRE